MSDLERIQKIAKKFDAWPQWKKDLVGPPLTLKPKEDDKKKSRVSPTMPPMPLADGPPTEPGWYWYCREGSDHWHIVQIEKRDNGTLRQSSIWYWDSNPTIPGQWSTKLPGPPVQQ